MNISLCCFSVIRIFRGVRALGVVNAFLMLQPLRNRHTRQGYVSPVSFAQSSRLCIFPLYSMSLLFLTASFLPSDRPAAAQGIWISLGVYVITSGFPFFAWMVYSNAAVWGLNASRAKPFAPDMRSTAGIRIFPCLASVLSVTVVFCRYKQ